MYHYTEELRELAGADQAKAGRFEMTALASMLPSVGLYKLNPVDPSRLKAPGFNP